MINWTSKNEAGEETLSANLDITIDLEAIDPFQRVGTYSVIYETGSITLPLNFSIYRRSEDDLKAEKSGLPYVLEVHTQGPIPSNVIYQATIELAKQNAEQIREALRRMVAQAWN